jgi:hypothetical protein
MLSVYISHITGLGKRNLKFGLDTKEGNPRMERKPEGWTVKYTNSSQNCGWQFTVQKEA